MSAIVKDRLTREVQTCRQEASWRLENLNDYRERVSDLQEEIAQWQAKGDEIQAFINKHFQETA